MENDIVFVNPFVPLERRYGALGTSGTRTAPLGLCYLASSVSKAGFRARIIDAEAMGLPDAEVVRRIAALKPRCAGITSTVLNAEAGRQLAAGIKKALPDTTVLAGGPQLTAMPEETMGARGGFDAGVIGEGEKTAVDVLRCLSSGGRLESVKGIIFRDGDGFKKTGPAEFIQNIDCIPEPAFDLLPAIERFYQPAVFSTRQRPAFSLVTARGCPGRCVFCDRAVFGNRVRAHSAGYVLNMIDRLNRQHGIREFAIADDLFLVFKDRLAKVCEELVRKDMGVTWSCNSRVDHIREELLPLMKRAGCWQVGLGLESGSQKILDALKKGVRVEEAEKAVRQVRKSGIRVKGFFMAGCPGETIDTLRQTISFAKRAGVDDFQMTFFTPLPGSEFFREAERAGTFERDFSKMSCWEPVYVPDGMTREELIGWWKRAYREFYLRPGTVISYLKNLRSAAAAGALARASFNLLRMFAGNERTNRP